MVTVIIEVGYGLIGCIKTGGVDFDLIRYSGIGHIKHTSLLTFLNIFV